MTLLAPDEELETILAYVRPALPTELGRHLEAVRFRPGSVEVDAVGVPVLNHLRANVGLAAPGGALAARVLGVHHSVPLLGWVSVSHDALAHLPQVRDLEARTWGLPGWRFAAARVEAGRVVLALERE